MKTIKIDNAYGPKLPRNTTATIERILSYVPREHLRGIDRLRLVASINDPRLNLQQRASLPGLYHPKQLNQPAWLEIAVDVLLPKSSSVFKSIVPRLSFKGNLAALIFSLVGQHYHFTMRHSVKKNRLENSVRSYTENYLKLWGEGEHRLRARLFKPLRPVFEKWAREVKRKEAATKGKSS